MKKLFISHGLFEPSIHVDFDDVDVLGLSKFVMISAKDFPGLENSQGLCTNLLSYLFNRYGLDEMQREIFLEGLTDNVEYIDVYRLFQGFITSNYLGGNPYRRVAVVYNSHANCECLDEEDAYGRDVCCVGRALDMVFRPAKAFQHAAA